MRFIIGFFAIGGEICLEDAAAGYRSFSPGYPDACTAYDASDLPMQGLRTAQGF